MRHIPTWLLAIALLVLVTACGDAGTSATSAPAVNGSSPATTLAEGATNDAVGTTTSGSADVESADTPGTTPAPAGPSFDGPPAEDFELALSDGSVFSPSAEEKPVYMVFWAEW